MLASAAAEAIDFEKLLWVPKPIITVPESITLCPIAYNLGEMVARAWVEALGDGPKDNIFDSYWLLSKLETSELVVEQIEASTAL